MSDLAVFADCLAADRHLALLITTRFDRVDPQVSMVNAGIIDHPVSATPVVALVARRGAKLANLRNRPRATIVARAEWEWTATRGTVELAGPDDPGLGIDPGQQRQLLRDIYHAAGGHHDDLDAYDRAMLRERRCAVLINPERCWTNPPGSEHLAPDHTGEHQ